VRQRRAFATEVATAVNDLMDVSLESLEAVTAGKAPWLTRVCDMRFGRKALRRAVGMGTVEELSPAAVAEDLVRRLLGPEDNITVGDSNTAALRTTREGKVRLRRLTPELPLPPPGTQPRSKQSGIDLGQSFQHMVRTAARLRLSGFLSGLPPSASDFLYELGKSTGGGGGRACRACRMLFVCH
jgi:hypothetical protein